ncbi:MAG: HXXEE domain-containing protein [Bacteroidales bacterium]|nr:HXXEE domain-containing protein [Bacteroidales bacterium]
MEPVLFIWAIPLFFSLHELEEWNILNWYQKYYVNLPGSTNFSIHLHIIIFCIMAFLLTYIAYLFRETFVFSLIIPFLSGFILFNTFQHIIWTFQLKAYSPGLASAIVMLCVTIFVNIILIKNSLIFLPFYALILLFILPALNTLKVKNEMTPEIRRVHLFFVKIENLIRNRHLK